MYYIPVSNPTQYQNISNDLYYCVSPSAQVVDPDDVNETRVVIKREYVGKVRKILGYPIRRTRQSSLSNLPLDVHQLIKV